MNRSGRVLDVLPFSHSGDGIQGRLGLAMTVEQQGVIGASDDGPIMTPRLRIMDTPKGDPLDLITVQRAADAPLAWASRIAA